MSPVIASPEIARTVPSIPIGAPAHEKGDTRNLCSAILRGAILAGVIGGALTLLAFGLVPAVFVTLMLFLPALAPILLVGLGIVFIADAERAKNEALDAAEQPCSCHRDRVMGR